MPVRTSNTSASKELQKTPKTSKPSKNSLPKEKKVKKIKTPKLQEDASTTKDPQADVPFWEREIPGFGGGNKTAKFKSKELVQFFKGVGSMLKAQMNTSDALHYYSIGLPNKKFASKLQSIRDNIKNGMDIKEAFSKAKCFDDATIGLVQSGSDAGRLDKAFAQLAKRLVTDQRFKKQLKKVILIPCIVIPILITAYIVSQVRITPQIEEMMSGVGAEPDPVSKIAFNISHAVQSGWPVFVIVSVTIIMIIVGSQRVRNFILNMLMARWRLLRKLVMSLRQLTVLSTMHLLHSNGINLARSMRLSSQTMKGNNFHNELLDAADRFELTGIPIATAFSNYTSIDEQVCHMIAIGERSASIDDSLMLMAELYEEEAENAMELLTHLMNAIVMILAMSVVSLIIISTFLPIFLMGPTLMQNAL